MAISAFNMVDSLIQKRNLSELESDFVSCLPLGTDLDVLQMVSNLADLFMSVVQYNGPVAPNIKSVCEIMTKHSPIAYQNLVALNKVSDWPLWNFYIQNK